MKLIIIGILLPLIGTTMGAMLVFLIKKNINKKWNSLLEGLASGVMLAASFFSLILPAIELSSDYQYFKVFPVVIGFILGMILLLIIDLLFKNDKLDMLSFAVIIHNIPEGLSIGVALYAAYNGNIILASEALALSFGIGIQNIPEGSIISLNMYPKKNKFKAFLSGFLSGVIEPIASIFAMVLIFFIEPLMPYFLSFAAGAMIYVVIAQIIPNSNCVIGNVGFCFGFCIMMILDVMFG